MLSFKKRYQLSTSFLLTIDKSIYNVTFNRQYITIYQLNNKTLVAKIDKQKYDFIMSGNNQIPLLYGVLKKRSNNYICECFGINRTGYFTKTLKLPQGFPKNNIELQDVIVMDNSKVIFLKVKSNKKIYWIKIWNNVIKLVNLPNDTLGIANNGVPLTLTTLKNIREYRDLCNCEKITYKYSGKFAVGVTSDCIYVFNHNKLIKIIKSKNLILDLEIINNQLYVIEINNAISRLIVYDLKENKKEEVIRNTGRIELSFPSPIGYTVKITNLLQGIKFYNCSLNHRELCKHFLYSKLEINVDRTLFDSHHMYTTILSDAKRNGEFIGNIFSFHGGPESYEQLDDRWLGEYLRYLSLGYKVFIVNYPGSISFGKTYKTSPWKNWSEVCSTGIKNLIKDSIKLKKLATNISWCWGGSFGAPIAYKVAKYLSNNNICDNVNLLLISPLIDLNEHINKLSEEDKKWFRKRFSSKDISYLSINKEKHIPKFGIYCYQGAKDEILTFQSTVDYFSLLKKRGYRNAKLVTNSKMKHAPQTFIEELSLLNFIKKAMKEESC